MDSDLDLDSSIDEIDPYLDPVEAPEADPEDETPRPRGPFPGRSRRGDAGPAVEALQTALDVTVDGVFGFETDAALRSAQREAGARVDGIFTAEAWKEAVCP